jgi:aspartyl-tRNA(Asn)/glutamyl-tRNA(Gln) amidotransferase subunit B
VAYEAVIGLEVHAQLRTATKLFCGCPAEFGAAPNSRTCPVCLGLPGTLPVLNDRAVALALRVGLATGCRIARRSVFARKNYFYPDVPKNYQITQYELPLCAGGHLTIRCGERMQRVDIARIHLEEDAGKLIHDAPGEARTLIDLNRAGVPLIEIVSEPGLHSGEEAHAYLTRLRQTLVYLDACDGNLEEGSLRCDANVSVRPRARHEERGQEPELLPRRLAGNRSRSRAAGRPARARRAGAARNAHLGRGRRLHPIDACEGIRRRLPLFPRAGPAAAAH